MKDTNVIIYDAGAYGHFINWCCSYFSGYIDTNIVPFTDTGSVHNSFPGNYKPMCSLQIEEYINSTDTIPFLQTHKDLIRSTSRIDHFKENSFEYIFDDFKYISENFKKSIYVYATKNSINWITNNSYYKIKLYRDLINSGISENPEEFLLSRGMSHQELNELKVIGIDRLRLQLESELSVDKRNAWGHNSILDFDLWELRELCCEYFYDRCYSKILTESQIEKLSNAFANIKFVGLDQLNTNFICTITEILNFFNINSSIDELNIIHQQWLPKQVYINADRQIAQIVDAIVNDVYFDWQNYNLTFFDEIFIQRRLLDMGIELACYQINTFPSNTKDFKSLLIKKI
jgi:hypothetical protein